MLDSNLHIDTLGEGTEQPNPTYDALQKDYHQVASIRVQPETDFASDLERVIAIVPTIKRDPPFQQVLKGYFAYGHTDIDGVVFDIYSPHPSMKGLSQKRLTGNVKAFAMMLNDLGYALAPQAIKYK